jgi:hypothetical protein
MILVREDDEVSTDHISHHVMSPGPRARPPGPDGPPRKALDLAELRAGPAALPKMRRDAIYCGTRCRVAAHRARAA